MSGEDSYYEIFIKKEDAFYWTTLSIYTSSTILFVR